VSAAKKPARTYKDTGIDGLYVCGSTGEGFVLHLKERKSILEVDSVSPVPCVYYRKSEAEIKQNWLNIIESTDLPFIIYNIPGTTGYDLSLKLFEEMASVEKVYGIKRTAMNSYQILQFRKVAGTDFVIFNGSDEQYLAGRLMVAEDSPGFPKRRRARGSQGDSRSNTLLLMHFRTIGKFVTLVINA